MKCKYCCDFLRAKFIINRSIPMFLGTRFHVSADINIDELVVCISESYSGTDSSDYKSFRTKINYCPMCGRKLESEEENGTVQN